MDARSLRFWLVVSTIAWLGLAGVGMSVLWRFDNAPGAAASAPAVWPSTTTLTRATDRATLVLMAHPQCTCTKATLDELAEVLARTDAHPRTYVVFLKPAGFDETWVEGDLWRQATELRDVTVVRDQDGREAQRFGAATSGQTFLYDTSGALVFSGGITAARAQAGDNLGRQSLVTLLNHGTATPGTNVFGCPLFNTNGGGI